VTINDQPNLIKCLIYSSDMVAEKIAPLIEEAGIKPVVISSELTSPDLEFLLSHSSDLELAILEINEEYTGCLCRFFGETKGIPVVLLVDNNTADWASLGKCEASAFVPLNAGKTELAVRLKAITSRIMTAKQREQKQLLFSERV
jgi:hypothetical protein